MEQPLDIEEMKRVMFKYSSKIKILFLQNDVRSKKIMDNIKIINDKLEISNFLKTVVRSYNANYSSSKISFTQFMINVKEYTENIINNLETLNKNASDCVLISVNKSNVEKMKHINDEFYKYDEKLALIFEQTLNISTFDTTTTIKSEEMLKLEETFDKLFNIVKDDLKSVLHVEPCIISKGLEQGLEQDSEISADDPNNTTPEYLFQKKIKNIMRLSKDRAQDKLILFRLMDCFYEKMLDIDQHNFVKRAKLKKGLQGGYIKHKKFKIIKKLKINI